MMASWFCMYATQSVIVPQGKASPLLSVKKHRHSLNYQFGQMHEAECRLITLLIQFSYITSLVKTRSVTMKIAHRTSFMEGEYFIVVVITSLLLHYLLTFNYNMICHSFFTFCHLNLILYLKFLLRLAKYMHCWLHAK